MMPPFKEISHEEWVQALIEQGFDPGAMVLVGARKIYTEEKENFKKSKIRLIKISDFENFLENEENFKLQDHDSVYLSLDLDVLDEKFFSATGYPVKKGLNPKQLKKILDKLFKLKNFKAMDLVEYNPERDNGKSLKIVLDIVNRVIEKEKR